MASLPWQWLKCFWPSVVPSHTYLSAKSPSASCLQASLGKRQAPLSLFTYAQGDTCQFFSRTLSLSSPLVSDKSKPKISATRNFPRPPFSAVSFLTDLWWGEGRWVPSSPHREKNDNNTLSMALSSDFSLGPCGVYNGADSTPDHRNMWTRLPNKGLVSSWIQCLVCRWGIILNQGHQN